MNALEFWATYRSEPALKLPTFHPILRGLDDELWLAERAQLVTLSHADALRELREREQDARQDWYAAGCPRKGEVWEALADAAGNIRALEDYRV